MAAIRPTMNVTIPIYEARRCAHGSLTRSKRTRSVASPSSSPTALPFQYAGGIADRGHQVPITSETRFGVASVTKMVTTTTALRLVDRGELRLDEPLIELLPAEQPLRSLRTLMSRTGAVLRFRGDRGGHAPASEHEEQSR